MVKASLNKILKKLSDMKVDFEDMGNEVEALKDEYEENTAQTDDIQEIVDALDSANDEVDEVIQKITNFKA